MSAPQRTTTAGLSLTLFITALIAGWPGEACAQPPPVDIGTLGIDSAPVAINAQGQIAGENALAPSPQRHAFSWTSAGGMIDLGTLGNFTSSYAVALNGRGHIVGNSYTNWGSQDSRAFSWTASAGMVDLGTLGGTRSQARGVNDRGEVVGESSLDQQYFHAFLWTVSGGMIDLGHLGNNYSTAAAVNAGGQVVGFSETSQPEGHAFSWTAAGGMIDLGTLGGRYSSAFALNERGQVVGESITAADARHAFSWTAGGGMIDLGHLGGNYSSAAAVNAHGQTIGNSVTAGDAPHAFSWTAADGMIDLGTLGGWASYALAVNASGQVVGQSDVAGSSGGWHAFSWTAAGGMMDLEPLPGDIASTAYAVNDQGVVAGISISLTRHRAVYWKTFATGPLRISTPNEAARWGVGTVQRLAWTYPGDAPQFQIDISRDGGHTWEYITTAANAAGSSQNFYWRVTSPLTMAARFRVTAITDPGASDINDANIRIANATIEILTPTESTVALVGSTLKVGIKHTLGAGAPVAIEVSADNGTSWRTAAQPRTTGSSTSSFQWVVDLLPTTRARVRVRALDGSLAKATSRAFTVSAAATSGGAR